MFFFVVYMVNRFYVLEKLVFGLIEFFLFLLLVGFRGLDISGFGVGVVLELLISFLEFFREILKVLLKFFFLKNFYCDKNFFSIEVVVKEELLFKKDIKLVKDLRFLFSYEFEKLIINSYLM